MLISIITTSYNSAATIGKTIESVVGQGHPEIELILIDGGSKDDTLEIVEKELWDQADTLKTENLTCGTEQGAKADGANAEMGKQKLKGEDGGPRTEDGGPRTAISQAQAGEQERAVATRSVSVLSAFQDLGSSAAGQRFIVVSERDGGIYDAMNKGVARATGDIVGILNSDDFYPHERVIAQVVERFEETGCDALYADCCYVDREETHRVTRYWKAGPYRLGAFRFGWMPPHPTFFVRKEHYDRLGSYRAEFKNSGDYELMLRFIHKHKLKLDYLPEVTVMMRDGGASNVSLKNRLRANREDREAWRINGLSLPFYTPYIKPLRKIGQLWAKPPFLKC